MENRVKIDGVEYATNDRGEGLFYWGISPSRISNQWIQIKGTCQFSVKGLKHPKEKIKRYVNKELKELGYK